MQDGRQRASCLEEEGGEEGEGAEEEDEDEDEAAEAKEVEGGPGV